MFYGFIVTESGNALLASMVAGECLEITRVVMDKGTVDSIESARKLTAPIEPGPNGTSTVPTVEGSSVNMIVEYRSDLNGGLTEEFWIGGFAIYGKTQAQTEQVIYYASLGHAKQHVNAYEEGIPPDVRRYPVSLTVTTGVEVTLSYPAEAWMTAEDVSAYFEGELRPNLETSLTNLLNNHNISSSAHEDLRQSLLEKADAMAVETALSNKANLTVDVRIPEGADMNNYLTPGDYSAVTHTLAATLVNAPFSRGFRLRVSQARAGYGDYMFQSARDFDGYIKIRTYNQYSSGLWTPWVQLATATPPQEYDLPLAEGVTGAATYLKSQENIEIVSFDINKSDKTAFKANTTMTVGTLPAGFRSSKLQFSTMLAMDDNSGAILGVAQLWTDVNGIVNVRIQPGISPDRLRGTLTFLAH